MCKKTAVDSGGHDSLGMLFRSVSEERPTEEALFGLKSEWRREMQKLEGHWKSTVLF